MAVSQSNAKVGGRMKYYELSDGKEYVFSPKIPTILEAIKNVYDEDWKTAVTHGNPCIPKGTKVMLEDIITNYHGKYLCIRHDGYLFYANPYAFKRVEMDEVNE